MVSDDVLTFKTYIILHLFIVCSFNLRLYISFTREHIYVYCTNSIYIFLLKLGVGQNITWQAPSTTKNYAFIVFAFMDHLASFSSNLP